MCAKLLRENEKSRSVKSDVGKEDSKRLREKVEKWNPTCAWL